MKAFEVIERCGWRRHFVDTAGGPTCVIGAFIVAYPHPNTSECCKAMAKLCAYLRRDNKSVFENLGEWNDSPDRTKQDVIDVLKLLNI